MTAIASDPEVAQKSAVLCGRVQVRAMMDDNVDAVLHIREEEEGRGRLHSHMTSGLQAMSPK
mgnify:CR=1 FL=1|jgi:hypothetical protein